MFSYILANLCLTSEMMLFTQTNNPWEILLLAKNVAFTVIPSSNVVPDLFFAFSGFLGAYRLF